MDNSHFSRSSVTKTEFNYNKLTKHINSFYKKYNGHTHNLFQINGTCLVFFRGRLSPGAPMRSVYAQKKYILVYKILTKVYASGNNKHKSNKHILFIVYVNKKIYSSPTSLATYYSILHGISCIITKREKEWDQCTNNKLY